MGRYALRGARSRSVAWTRDFSFPLPRLSERMMCLEYGSRRVTVAFSPPRPGADLQTTRSAQRAMRDLYYRTTWSVRTRAAGTGSVFGVALVVAPGAEMLDPPLADWSPDASSCYVRYMGRPTHIGGKG
ncbi:hypothetical protein GCM10008179_29070 [Hansschlegelia plantiphila]|uniref:Uncharacterized protein n=1 Tax=Hansschlegelia plantiphila TaxID=374655 RepID=A0A9W6J4L3_9HYPH|nr:hypothetical protein GCM10008179_29070 [Hansschlegelia plantiphila]